MICELMSLRTFIYLFKTFTSNLSMCYRQLITKLINVLKLYKLKLYLKQPGSSLLSQTGPALEKSGWCHPTRFQAQWDDGRGMLSHLEVAQQRAQVLSACQSNCHQRLPVPPEGEGDDGGLPALPPWPSGTLGGTLPRESLHPLLLPPGAEKHQGCSSACCTWLGSKDRGRLGRVDK